MNDQARSIGWVSSRESPACKNPARSSSSSGAHGPGCGQAVSTRKTDLAAAKAISVEIADLARLEIVNRRDNLQLSGAGEIRNQ